MTDVISGTISTKVFSTPSFNVRSIIPQPWQPPPNWRTACSPSSTSTNDTSPPSAASQGFISEYKIKLILSSKEASSPIAGTFEFGAFIVRVPPNLSGE